jgi:hypothetical protein
MNILVTDETGFIGSGACAALTEATAIVDHADDFKNTPNSLAPTSEAMADTIARQFGHPAGAPMPAEMSWQAQGTTPAMAMNGTLVDRNNLHGMIKSPQK